METHFQVFEWSITKKKAARLSVAPSPNHFLETTYADDLDSFSIGSFFPTAAANSKMLVNTRRHECTRFGEELELDVMQKHEGIGLLSAAARVSKHKQT